MSENTPQLSYLEDLGATVDYAAASTVSTTALRVEGANVVVFSFDTGEELSEHTAAVPVLIQVLEGEVEMRTEGRTVQLRPGGLVHLPTRLPHAVRALAPTKMVLFMLTGQRVG